MLRKTISVCLILASLHVTGSENGCVIASDSFNVILITVDDLNTSLGCYDHPQAQTPNIDRLARQGARFARAYSQYPLCNPSRASFLSGKRPDTTGVISNKIHPKTRLTSDMFLPEYFASNGYFTARAGKISHNASRDSIEWDSEYNPPPDERIEMAGHPDLPDWKATEMNDSRLPDGLIAQRIIELLRERRDKPFFLAAGFHRPHGPFIAPKRYFDLYDVRDIQLPPEASADGNPTVIQKKEILRAYLACISFVDAQIGLILDELDRLDLRRNTIIVFASDHGLRLGEGKVFGRKRSLDEIVIKIPLIVAAPDIPQGLVLGQIVELVDIFPSLTELCGLPSPPEIEGLSFVPLLREPDRGWKRAAFTEYTEKRHGFKRGRSVQTERFKYIRRPNGREFLYDLIEDPKERINLVRNDQYLDALREMRMLLAEGWRSALP